MNNLEVKIQNKTVGGDNPCYIIAEIGSNHNNNYNTALELIDAASDSGADAVKLQTFRASQHYSKYSPKILQSDGSYIDPYLLVESLEMDREWISGLTKYASSKSIHLFSSPCDLDAISLFSSVDSPAYKVASFDLTDLKLVEEIAKIKKPIILSTGLANYADIQRAVNTCKNNDNNNIILMQCTSVYPAPVSLSNLNTIRTIRLAFNVVTGYSDHTLGDHICIAAVALGASVIEKHFTLDAKLAGPDHHFAIEPNGLRAMVDKIHDIEVALGDGVKDGPRAEEVELYEKARRSIHAAIKIKKGEVITDSMLCVKRPSYGIDPYLIERVVGRKAMRDIKADEWITWSDI